MNLFVSAPLLLLLSLPLSLGQSLTSPMTFSRFAPASAPLPRAFSVVATNSTTVIFSGGRAGTTPDSAPGDLLVDPLTLLPTQRSASPTPVLGKLAQAAVAQVPEPLVAALGGVSAYAFGGVDLAGAESATLWALGASGAWAAATPTGTAPRARAGATLTFLSACGNATRPCLVLVGGASKGYAATAADFVWAVYFAPLRWALVATSLVNAPPAGLVGHSAAASADGGSVIVYGGTKPTGISSDTFQLSSAGFFDAKAAAAEMTNIARLKPTAASSSFACAACTPTSPNGNLTSGGSLSASAVDGNSAQAYGTGVGTCFVSYYNAATLDGTANPWWRVDLGSVQPIFQLRFWVRTDVGFTTYNTGVSFWVSSSTAQLPWVPGSGAVRVPNPFIDPIYSPNIITLTAPISGRYVWAVQLGVAMILQLCELQVLQPTPWMWRQLSGVQNLALNKYALQAAVNNGFAYGDPLNACDGITGTVSRTPGGVSNVWWMVDLGETKSINYITVLDGAGTNWARNNASEIVIGDSTDPHSATNKLCFGPAPITCNTFSTVPPGLPRAYGADGWYNSKLCTSQGGAITVSSCSGSGRYVFIRKRDKFAASPNGMWYPGFSVFDQCKYQLTTGSAAHPGCEVCQNDFLPGLAASGDPKPCGTCPVLSSTLCTTAPYAQWGGQGLGDAQMLVLAEVSVFGNLQRFNPVGRTGASSATYGSHMVIFGGQDVNGFLLNDVRLFDTIGMQWEPITLPLGTPPPGRAFAGIALLPSGVAGRLLTDNAFAPSNKLLIFGGVGPASTFSDVSVLTFVQCPRFGIDPSSGSQVAGLNTVACSAGGSICSYTCFSPFVINPANPSGIAACSFDGTWAQTLPLCVASSSAVGVYPSAPSLSSISVVTPTAPSGAALSMTINRPSTLGYGNSNGPTLYTVYAASQFWMYRFVGQPFDVTAWNVNPGLPANSLVANTYAVAANGYLMIGTAAMGMCALNKQDCSIISRPFPQGDGLPNIATDAWTIEAQVSFNIQTANTPVSLNEIGIGLFDSTIPVTVPNPLNATLNVNTTGGLHFFTSLKLSGSTYVFCWTALNAATPASFCNTAPSLRGTDAVPGFTGFFYGSFRIDRVPDERFQTGVTTTRPGYGSWRFGQKFYPGWPWSYSQWLSDASMLRPDALGRKVWNPAAAQLAFVGVSGSATKSYGEIRYVRFGALVASPPGPVLQVPATTSSSVVTQSFTTPAYFSAGSSIALKVTSSGSLGQGDVALASSPVTVPYSPQLVWDPALWVEVALNKRQGGVDSGGIIPANPVTGAVAGDFAAKWANNGVPNGVPGGPDVTTAQFFTNYAPHTTGSWWWVDFGIPTAVKELVIYNRYDSLWSQNDNFKVALSNLPYLGEPSAANGGPPFGAINCEQSQIPPSIPFSSVYNGYPAAVRFNCSYPTGLVGRYLYITNNPGFSLQLREVQVYASNRCPARTATQATQVPFSACAAGSPYGSVCAFTCNAGFYQISGAGKYANTPHTHTRPPATNP